ncbi:hypothetical protein MJ904_22675 [Massilia sp. MB5]|uniref:hypothetical protein n=1 Tax=unclassified Massilia TaxID=2609279 RepID=UPI00067CC490|nr:MULTISPECIES: hypothetical protein [unclassified Massilia]AKU20703.1 hypothetical protein ACZ75_03430 [Massilia sp. NR 4-1]UMR29810.1 hypothetical protein MJ904_22675 [Massilia sp. MB5]
MNSNRKDSSKGSEKPEKGASRQSADQGSRSVSRDLADERASRKNEGNKQSGSTGNANKASQRNR